MVYADAEAYERIRVQAAREAAENIMIEIQFRRRVENICVYSLAYIGIAQLFTMLYCMVLSLSDNMFWYAVLINNCLVLTKYWYWIAYVIFYFLFLGGCMLRSYEQTSHRYEVSPQYETLL